MTFAAGQAAIVVDASAAIELLQGHDAWHGRWREWIDSDAMILVPPHFPFEVANVLLRGLRLEPQVAAEHLDRLYESGFEVADRGSDGLNSALRLAAQHHLTVYEAAYLQLALDVDAALATLDGDLRAAAVAEGLPVIG